MGRKRTLTIEPLNPDVRTLAKLGSIIGHVDELLSTQGHIFDHAAIVALVAEPDVQQWLEAMRKLALIPI
jgi:hypothetical protein